MILRIPFTSDCDENCGTPFRGGQGDTFANRKELRLEDMHGREWVLLASYANPRVFEMIQTTAFEKGVAASDRHYVMTAEEASELIRTRKGWHFCCSDGIAMRPLREERLKLVTRLATRPDHKPRLLSEFVRDAGRKWNSISPPQQGRLPLAG